MARPSSSKETAATASPTMTVTGRAPTIRPRKSDAKAIMGVGARPPAGPR